MKVEITDGEWYPCYSVQRSESSTDNDVVVELSEEEWADYWESEQIFDEWQTRLSALFWAAKAQKELEKNGPPPPPRKRVGDIKKCWNCDSLLTLEHHGNNEYHCVICKAITDYGDDSIGLNPTQPSQPPATQSRGSC